MYQRFDENDGWRPIPPCEAEQQSESRLAPVMLASVGLDAIGQALWIEGGFKQRRDETRRKLVNLRSFRLLTDPSTARPDWEHAWPWLVGQTTKEEGVYVDISQTHPPKTTLGFAVRIGTKKMKKFSILWSADSTAAAELDAIRIARLLFPNLKVFSDHEVSAKGGGATYINRRFNTFAHAAAKYQTNLYNRQRIDGLPDGRTIERTVREYESSSSRNGNC